MLQGISPSLLVLIIGWIISFTNSYEWTLSPDVKLRPFQAIRF